jgi:1-acyl-sn-glycerol-3-phosphate acyltransferase
MVSSVKNRNTQPRHTWWYRFFMRVPVRCFFLPLGTRVFNIRPTKYKGKVEDKFILVFNHACDYDFVGVLEGFPGYYRFVMSDELIKKRHKRMVIRTVTDGIYRRKGENAHGVAEGIKASLDQGISVCMAPEGEETPNGVTMQIRKKTGQLVKEMGVDLITYRLEGGYGFLPKWTNERAKGPIRGHLVNIYKKEQLTEMTPEEINDLIAKDLYFNFYEWNRTERKTYIRKNRAENIERILYTCPKCGSMGKLHSQVHDLFCEECGYKVTLDEYGFFQGDELRFDNIYDWDMWQKDGLKSQRSQWEADPDRIITSNTGGTLKRMKGDDQEVIDEDVKIEITFNDIIITGPKTDMRFPLTELEGLTTIAHGVAVSYGGEYYKIRFPYEGAWIRYRSIRRIIMEEEYI